MTPLREIGSRRVLPAVLAAALMSIQCADRGVGPPPPPPSPGLDGEECPACTPEDAMESLDRAFEERDPDLLASLLDDGFWFTEENCLGQLIYWNDKEEELKIMGGGDSTRGIFDVFRTIEFDFWTSKRYEESGADSPMAFEGDVDGHPEEDWLVFRGRVELLLLSKPDEGFFVDQLMNFKLRQDEDGMWRIRRWVCDPLSTACGEASGRAAAEANSWGWVKAWVMAAASG